MLAPILFAAAAATAAPPKPPLQPPPPACRAASFREFDFWLGDWNAFATGTRYRVGTSRVEKLYDGCALRENWAQSNGYGSGGSLNHYDPKTRSWRQTWTDSQNGWREYAGAFRDGAMRLVAHTVGLNGKPQINRMTFTPNADGSVRQVIEVSQDDGKTWAAATDLTYRRTGE